MRGALHRYRDMLYEKAFGFTIPFLVKLNLTPNQITVLRFLVLIPPSVFLFTLNNYFANIGAVALFHLFAFFDIVDGKLAVIRGMCTRLGEIIDPPIDYIGHNLVFIGITIGVLGSNGAFQIGPYSISIPVQFFLICCILTIVGFSVPIIFSMIPPTRFFMFQDLHDLHEDFFPAKRVKSNNEPLKIWLCKNIICPYNFPFNIIFKIGPLLTICVLLNTLFISLIVFPITLNIRVLTLFYYFFKIYKKQKPRLSR
jgi:hypothetical protein